MAYFYRRPNGVYYARIRVPDPLRAIFGAPDLRRSLHTSDRALASRLALAAAFEWKSEFQRLRLMIDAHKLVTGSPLLHMPGLISLADASTEVGLTVRQLFSELVGRRCALRIRADGWMGADVPRDELVSDDPGEPALIDLGSTLDGRRQGAVFGELLLRHEAMSLVEGDVFHDCVFYRDAGRRQAVVMDLPGVMVALGALLAQRTDVEVVRIALASHVTPAMLEAAARTPAAPSEALDATAVRELVREVHMGAAYEHREAPVSAMLNAYYADKGAGWSRATAEQNKRMCAVFVDLMADPALGTIDRSFIKSYRAKLRGVPLNLHRVKTKYPGVGLTGLVELAVAGGLPTMDEARADRHVAKIGEAFAWASKNGYMIANPAAHLAVAVRTVKRKQDNRQTFDAATLAQIFGQPWFRDGRGEQTKLGRYHQFQPFYYWMPLIALFTGARLNEIAQLYLKDVAVSELGQWYLDFNLDGDGKVDADDADQHAGDSGGKQLKTINAVRIVALHPELVRLGLPDYVQALRETGQARLFPELKRDQVKGFGKYAGQWFNERFLGKKLGMARDGTQTFHSFRHTFLTACDRLGMPDRVRDELAGHSRGKGEGHATYIKDRSADEQAPHLEPLQFELPPVAPFDVPEGLRALGDALSRKQRH